MMTKTAIGEKLESRGFIPRNVELQIAIAKFQNNGGEYGVALAMLNAAYGKGSGGSRAVANDGLFKDADASRIDDVVGQVISADKAVPDLPTTSPNRSGGRLKDAENAFVNLPSAAARLPGHARRGAAAIAAVQDTVAKSLFDTTTLPDGRSLREVHWSECPSLATRYRKLSRVLMAIHGHAVPADPNTKLDSLVSEDGLKDIISSVERFNDVA